MIEELDTQNDEPHAMERDDFETKYHNTAGRLTRIVKSMPQLGTNYANNARYREQTPFSQGSSGIMAIRSYLPRLALEQFYGNYNNWQQF